MQDYLNASDWARLRNIERQLSEQKGLLISVERAARRQKPGRTICRPDFGLPLVRMAAAYARDEGSERIEEIRRSAVDPARTDIPGGASELTQSVIAGFVLSLAGPSAYAAVIARTAPLNFGKTGTQSVSYGGEAVAGFAGEGDMIGITSANIGKLLIKPAKITAIASFSSELARSSNFEAVLRTLLRDAVAKALDSVFFSADAGSAAAPAGILAGVTAIPPSTRIDLELAMVEDLANLVKALDGPADPVFVVSPERRLIAAATLPSSFDYPVLASSAIPSDRVVCIDAAAVAAAHGSTPGFLTSTEATVLEQDQAGVTSPLMSGTPVRSYWQTDTRGLMVSLDCAWKVRPGGSAYTENVTW
ncbi:phage major capsid protein [Bradyrhizobium sp. BRP14]|nr:phage major capsid protein [Bradyrhizobium sp. BRP14]